MLKVWAVFFLMYAVLPFHVVDRQLTIQGFFLLFLFILAFCVGTLGIQPARRRAAICPPREIDFSTTDTVLTAASVVTIVAMLLELWGKNVFDLAASYDLRSDQAAALMEGAASSSTIWFQIGFLTYPAGYAYLVRGIIFDSKLDPRRLLFFGFVPVLLATVSMGGRSPLLYAILISFFSFGTRRFYLHRLNPTPRGARPPVRTRGLGLMKNLGIAAIVLGAMYYFVAVFLTRAESLGGAAGMFQVAERIWGISFSGPVATFMFQMLGDEFTYIIFVFNWYVVQGLVMANFLFSDYTGPMQWGVYGVDLVSALVRRINGDLVARNFDSLQQVGVYGFLPSAFGSLYVDLWFFGLLIAAAWGLLASLVYKKVRAGRDARWLLLAPLMTSGVLFSFINTPLGFANGLVTHFWILLAFLSSCRLRSARRTRLPVAPQAD